MSTGRPGILSISLQRLLVVMVMTSLLIFTALNAIPFAQADDADSAVIDEPNVELRHDFGRSVDDITVGNEVWTLDVTEGDVTLLFMARNLTTVGTGAYWIDYQFNINYHSGGSLYIAQITTMNTAFAISGQRVSSPLDSADRMEMIYTPVQYVGGVPFLYCNITFYGIDVYANGPVDSTYDLTLCHKITVNQNQTDVKVEAIFDLDDTKLIDPTTNQEYAVGTPFSVELPYTMMLTLPNSHGEPIPPTGHTDTSMEYDLTDASGNPLRVSQLKMNNTFSIFNETGEYAATGYSSMQYGAQSQVTHGFPNLVYGETRMIKSDPQITVFYDRIGGIGSEMTMILAGVAIAAIAAVLVVSVIIIRRGRRVSKDK